VLELEVGATCDMVVTHIVRDLVEIKQFGIKAIQPGAFLRSLKVKPLSQSV
jgi:hypothetical protein